MELDNEKFYIDFRTLNETKEFKSFLNCLEERKQTFLNQLINTSDQTKHLEYIHRLKELNDICNIVKNVVEEIEYDKKSNHKEDSNNEKAALIRGAFTPLKFK